MNNSVIFSKLIFPKLKIALIIYHRILLLYSLKNIIRKIIQLSTVLHLKSKLNKYHAKLPYANHKNDPHKCFTPTTITLSKERSNELHPSLITGFFSKINT